MVRARCSRLARESTPNDARYALRVVSRVWRLWMFLCRMYFCGLLEWFSSRSLSRSFKIRVQSCLVPRLQCRCASTSQTWLTWYDRATSEGDAGRGFRHGGQWRNMMCLLLWQMKMWSVEDGVYSVRYCICLDWGCLDRAFSIKTRLSLPGLAIHVGH